MKIKIYVHYEVISKYLATHPNYYLWDILQVIQTGKYYESRDINSEF